MLSNRFLLFKKAHSKFQINCLLQFKTSGIQIKFESSILKKCVSFSKPHEKSINILAKETPK